MSRLSDKFYLNETNGRYINMRNQGSNHKIVKMKFLSALFVAVFAAAVTAAPSMDNRIIGGQKAQLGEYPYIISLQRYGSHSCGGSIISENFVLTAAHCVDGNENNPTGMTVQYGIINLNSNENKIIVKKVYRNEDYRPGGGYFNDVAVLELSEKIVFGPSAQPVKLPSADSYPGDDASAVLVGWGSTVTGGGTPRDLMKVNITLFTPSYCEARESQFNPEKHVCAGVLGGGRGQCNGDSGGPLTVDGVQYGVVSWSVKPCANPTHPGVFANVVSYRNWIREKSGV